MRRMVGVDGYNKDSMNEEAPDSCPEEGSGHDASISLCLTRASTERATESEAQMEYRSLRFHIVFGPR